MLGGIALAGLNIAVFVFYALLQIGTLRRSTAWSPQGLDSSQMLPNADLFWLAANASLLMLLCLDVLVGIFDVMMVNANRKPTVMTNDRSNRPLA